MTIYIDNDYKCHTEEELGMRAVDERFFDGKCKEFIEGYRLVPDGETWTSDDGTEYVGKMLCPWKNYDVLSSLQSVHTAVINSAADAYSEGVNSI